MSSFLLALWIGVEPASLALEDSRSLLEDHVPSAPQEGARIPSPNITVVSLNTAQEEDSQRILRTLAASALMREADVYAFQEVVTRAGTPVVEEVARQLGHHVAFAPSTHPALLETANGDQRDLASDDDQGLAILSRYPITDAVVLPLERHDVVWHNRRRFTLAVTVETPAGPVRIWNIHLDNRINSSDRLEQLAPVLAQARDHAGAHGDTARIIAGDFNTNNFFWIGHIMPIPVPGSHTSAVRKAMEEAGFQTPFEDSLITLPRVLRHLDWIFMDRLEALASGVEPVEFSDHRAVWAQLRIGE